MGGGGDGGGAGGDKGGGSDGKAAGRMVTPNCVELTWKRPPKLAPMLCSVKLAEGACASLCPPS